MEQLKQTPMNSQRHHPHQRMGPIQLQTRPNKQNQPNCLRTRPRLTTRTMARSQMDRWQEKRPRHHIRRRPKETNLGPRLRMVRKFPSQKHNRINNPR
jgi:hypothetical protein